MHVGRGLRDAAQPRHAPFAEVAVLRLHVARAGRGAARRVVVEAAEQVVRALLQLPDAFETSGVHPAGGAEEAHAGVGELAVGELRARMAERAVALAYENAQAPLRR